MKKTPLFDLPDTGPVPTRKDSGRPSGPEQDSRRGLCVLSRRFVSDTKAAALTEYSVLIGLITGLVIAIIAAVGLGITDSWGDVEDGLVVSNGGGSGGAGGAGGTGGSGGTGGGTGGTGGTGVATGPGGTGGPGGGGPSGGGPSGGGSGGTGGPSDTGGGGSGVEGVVVASSGGGTTAGRTGSGAQGNGAAGGAVSVVSGSSSVGSSSGSSGAGYQSQADPSALQMASAEEGAGRAVGQKSASASDGEGFFLSGFSFSDVPAGGRRGGAGEGSSYSGASEQDEVEPSTRGGAMLTEESSFSADFVASLASLLDLEPAAGEEGATGERFNTEIVAEVAASGKRNSRPLAQDDHYRVTLGSSIFVPASYGPLVNDRDPDGDSLTAVLLEEGPRPSAFYFRSDGTLVFAADSLREPLKLHYRAFDGQLYSDVATITIEVVER